VVRDAKASRDAVESTSFDRLRTWLDDSLRDQGYVLSAEFWLRSGNNSGALIEAFGLGDLPTSAQLTELARIREVNVAVHGGKPTAGAARLKPLVAESQDGAYCRMCGDAADLHVDHIVPTSRGGTEHLSNLQLLCAQCNLGKGATQFGSLPAALAVRRDDTFPDALRFLRLSLNSELRDGRPMGHCDLGHEARRNQLSVSCRPRFAANLINLRVDCGACNA
jgi:hypothetical protein